MKFYKLLLMIAISCPVFAYGPKDSLPVNPKATPEARALLKYLYSIQGKSILSGQNTNKYSVDVAINNSKNLNGGKTPALIGTDFTYEDKNRASATKKLISYARQGAIIEVSWHAVPITHPESDATGWESVKSDVSTDLIDKMLTEGTTENKEWYARMDRIAVHLKMFQDSMIPVIWRPFHECNGGWFWWGRQPRFKDLWIQEYKRFTDYHKLNNLLWLYSPNYAASYCDPYSTQYPGHQYVDLLAADIYIEYQHTYNKSHFDQLMALGEGRPVGIGECGQMPNVPRIFSQGQPWVWWMVWDGFEVESNGSNVHNPKALYTTNFGSSQTLTMDEVNWRKFMQPTRVAIPFALFRPNEARSQSQIFNLLGARASDHPLQSGIRITRVGNRRGHQIILQHNQ